MTTRAEKIQAAALFFLPVLLIVRCWNAPFLPYDDPWHIYQCPLVMDKISIVDLFRAPQDPLYYPLTVASFRLDRSLFQGWMETWLHSWGPGVRFMNYIYHAIAAVLLWRVFLKLQPNRNAAFAMALFFAVHPAFNEAVCWPCERKTVLAGLFAFASLLAYFKCESPARRTAAVSVLYLVALLAKPSALGLLPIFVMLEILGGRDAFTSNTPKRNWVSLAPLTILSGLFVFLNLYGHAKSTVSPPGGSIFTAALTDVEILLRYMKITFVPWDLSIAYYVPPALTPVSLQFMLHFALLSSLMAVTICLARNRKIAVLGWFWFVGALGPNLNLIAISHLMQDRYLYLSMPGLLLVAAETISGIHQRFAAGAAGAGALPRGSFIRIGVSAYVVCIAGLAFVRGGLFDNLLTLAQDAVRVQPQSSHAHYVLAEAYAQAHEIMKRQNGPPDDVEALRKSYYTQYAEFLNCPDAERQNNYSRAALMAAQFYKGEAKKAEAQKNPLHTDVYYGRAEQYFQLAASGAGGIPPFRESRVEALNELTWIARGKLRLADAYKFATDALQLEQQNDSLRLARARMALEFALEQLRFGRKAEARKLRDEADADLKFIKQTSALYVEAQKLLGSPQLDSKQFE